MSDTKIDISSNRTDWFSEYSEEIKRLRKIIPSKLCCCYMHVGATAARSVMSRPIIDIAIGVINSIDLITVRDILVFNGYKFLENKSNLYDLFLEKKYEGKSSFYVHVVTYNGNRWNEMYNFTEYLRVNPNAAKEYSAFKTDLLIKKKVSAIEYERLKAEYISKLLEKIK